MTVSRNALAIFGSDEPVAEERLVQCGDLSFFLEAESIRSISWRGVEVVRGIAWPIRDRNWVTLVQEEPRQTAETGAEGFLCTTQFAVGDDGLKCCLEIRAEPAGRLSAVLSMTARRNFKTNRAGFTVLHPIAGVAGSALSIRHSDGSVENSLFPLHVRPDQPAKDIVGLAHEIGGVEVDLSFTGEVFEMEDQRNWTDASFKTYCRPLVFPFTYTIPAGETVRQTIELALSGTPSDNRTSGDGAGLRVAKTGGTFPYLGLAIEPGWTGGEAEREVLEPLSVNFLQVRMVPGADQDYLEEVRDLAGALSTQVDAEIVIPSDNDAEPALRQAAEGLRRAGLNVDRVTALPADYLASHQPSGPWPDGPTPREAATAARKVFPDARIGGGVLTNFTEFNRCRPVPDEVDFVTHGTTAIVHAADDRSVLETLEAQPQVFESAQALSGGKPYRLGLVSIGMRSNPYGADVAANPDLRRRTMARDDPRQRGLFAAAWAVGTIAAAAGAGAEALSLGAPAGPFSLFGQTPEDRLRPLYHVVRFAGCLGGHDLAKIDGLPAGLHGFAAWPDTGLRFAIANLSGATVQVDLPEGLRGARVLDATVVRDAGGAADWSTRAPMVAGTTVSLEPYAVLFAGGDD